MSGQAGKIIDNMMEKDLFSQWLGIERLEESEGYCRLKMTIRKEMCNGFDIAHGGITFSFADSALAFASNSHGRQAVSIETSISHIKPLVTDDVIIATATEKHIGNSIGIYEVRVEKESGGTGGVIQRNGIQKREPPGSLITGLFFLENRKNIYLLLLLQLYCMRKISLWAKHNRFPAIVFLIAGKLLLVLMAFFIGSSLQEMGIHIPAFIYITAIAMLLLAVLFYPRKKSGVIFKTIFYARQKSCDFAIGLCAFIITAVLVNTDFSIAYPVMSSASNTATVNPPAAADILASLQYRDKSSLTKKEKTGIKTRV
ncbi:MAG: hotdog fold thioesterase [Bacteroidota bacterium]